MFTMAEMIWNRSLVVLSLHTIMTQLWSFPQVYRALLHLSAHSFISHSYLCCFQQHAAVFRKRLLINRLLNTCPAPNCREKISDYNVTKVEHLVDKSHSSWWGTKRSERLNIGLKLILMLLCVWYQVSHFIFLICPCYAYSLLHCPRAARKIVRVNKYQVPQQFYTNTTNTSTNISTNIQIDLPKAQK